MRLRLVGVLGGALLLSACATARAPDEAPTPPTPGPSPDAPPADGPPPAPIAFSALTGWAEADHAEAFAAYQATCGVAKASGEVEICRRARAQPRLDNDAAQAFFEANFRLEPVPGEGVLTAYY
ncbi:MAG: MltA domain-containing protein, partial [Alphaproteobacteria bacterium]|nr:MltA domain-containing protein [Alphaproteobacteria bacterium]